MERRTLRRGTLVALAILLAGGGGWWAWRRRTARTAPAGSAFSPDVRIEPIVPAATRIRVEVLNATTTKGLGRRATLYLRDLGFDVVRFASDTSRREGSLVIDRSGHPAWARLLAKGLGGAEVQQQPDSSRYVDLTVLVGATWRPPAKPLYP